MVLPKNPRMSSTFSKLLELLAPSKECANRSQNSRRHHRRLTVDRDVTYY